MPPKKMTATDQKRYAEMVQVASETLWDFRHPDFVKSILPREWSDIPLDAVPEKVRITLRVDTDVAKFFRKLGRGVYQDRMNTVLRTFMLARLTEVLGTDEGFMLAETDELGKLYLSQEADLLAEVEKLRRKRMGIG
ncbi:BrnA antitoxin family protein [Loktanella sp. F6476L]|uniref:BrnA antitoxin family protein n=1 Tax=Loktanella sp. F6476L TaxID=2926405 RepID=UPI001FF2B1B0|nr:BrnA antitoxin family protein [Loktanella sp. F6476L]MCK0120105.1 BrnA antitoxin family protein [Loktanella sp. F6476L]UWQ98904.1 BrnA antitoxin family protein [Rhodobacteraceae bacterium S2214]